MWLFHSATVFCCYICTCICCLKLHQADYQVGEGFFNSIWWGGLSSNIYTICAVYWSLGRRGYFGVSNVVLVVIVMWLNRCIETTYWIRTTYIATHTCFGALWFKQLLTRKLIQHIYIDSWHTVRFDGMLIFLTIKSYNHYCTLPDPIPISGLIT